MKPTALVSFPRSGRHMMHSILATAYGLPDVHIDRADPRAPGHPLVVSHDVRPMLEETDGRFALVMIRCPFEALLSFHKLMNPQDQSRERFEWSLFESDGTKYSGWIAYYKGFVNHHVLTSDDRYPTRRLIVGYRNYLNADGAWLKLITAAMGGRPDIDKALRSHKVALRNDCWKHPFYQDEALVAAMRNALEPEYSKLRALSVI